MVKVNVVVKMKVYREDGGKNEDRPIVRVKVVVIVKMMLMLKEKMREVNIMIRAEGVF